MSAHGDPPDKPAPIRGRNLGPILIVDDDRDEAKLTERAVATLHPGMAIKLLYSGQALCAYLQEAEALLPREIHPLPCVILLDLRMPEMDGFGVLEWMRGKPEFAQIPIVVLSGHSELEHLRRAYALSARGFLVKPINVESFRHVLSSVNISL
jgi:CheY-like chemotaxis protein